MNGHVVGINSSKIVATGYEGLGFAIPSDTVQPIVSDLIEYGYVKDRAMLGITGAYVDRMSASFYGLTQGFVVEKATSEEAQKAGLEMYDVITAIDDTQVTSASTISSYIANKKPGETVTPDGGESFLRKIRAGEAGALREFRRIQLIRVQVFFINLLFFKQEGRGLRRVPPAL